MKSFFSLLLALVTTALWAQDGNRLPEFTVEKMELEAKLRFLASDDLKGRRTGSEGNNLAARFIAENLKAYGYQPVAGAEGYYQPIPFESSRPPQSSSLKVQKSEFVHGEDYLILSGVAANITGTAVFANYGWVDAETNYDDYQDIDVAGKVVFVLPGRPDASDPLSIFNAMAVKRKLAEERGAVALIELYRLTFPWEFFKRYFSGETLRVADGNEDAAGNKIVYGWIKDISSTEDWSRMQTGKKTKVTLTSSGFSHRPIASQNVIGMLEGTDPELKNEYILLTAHFDHVGVGRQGGGNYTQEDSIFNGARDNAMGTVALLTAAQSLAKERPKRSVIVLAVTGEELGLLGSKYYAEHPLVPLDKVIFNLNTDGAGYNDTDYISVFGFGRTGTDEHIEASARAFGLEVFPDPAPEQNLFDRSDNASFAAKGVPALTISPGLTAFDEKIGKYYHQVTDEADSVDMDYFRRYCQSFAYLARMIANDEKAPAWKEGDKYFDAGKKLYGN